MAVSEWYQAKKRRREHLVFLIVSLVLIFTCGCSNNSFSTLESGKYVLESSEEVVVPYVLLEENNRFVFMYSVLSSYLPVGTYSVDGDKLILTTDDETESIYVFSIKKNKIVFVADESTDIPSYQFSSKSVGDGAEFVVFSSINND